jgi:glycosyltransferase involved in cell wall biosynthesis
VVLEWLCAGLPVISSAVGGVTELINEDNGLLVASGNSQALAEAMQHLMNHYGNYNRGEIARTAAATYSYEAVGLQLVELYSELNISKSAESISIHEVKK